MGRLNGKVAIITGAGNGIGACESKLFAKEGAKVVVTDIDFAAAQAVVKQIVADGGQAIAIKHDVSSESDWKNVIAGTVEAFKKIDILVNNAAILIEQKMADITLETWNKTMQVNLNGVFLGTQGVVPEMKKNGGGSIVNTSSIASMIGSSVAHYSASKGGIRSFTKTTAIEYAKDKIRANSVYPGLIVTNLTKNVLADEAMRNFLTALTPLPRFGEVEDVAYGVLYLASDEASFVTGSELVIDGGVTSH